MIPVNQRWRFRKHCYRPDGETIRKSEYEVETISTDKEAKNFCLTHHYSGSYPAARFRFGLYNKNTLVGCAVFSHPCNDKVLSNVFPVDDILSCVELGRFVLLDSVPGNGETFFLGRCFDYLRKNGIVGVISFSDPIPRLNRDGDIVFPGHLGTIYQAHNGIYLGRGTARTIHILPDGKVLSDRAIQKIRGGERGWQYAANLLQQYGASAPSDEGIVSWLNHWINEVTYRMKHPGNYKYAWGLTSSIRKYLPPSLPYPKIHHIAKDQLKFTFI
jgi:hypothetical protein